MSKLSIARLITTSSVCIAWFASSTYAAGLATYSGTVVYVDDGDTVVVLLNNHTQLKVRLSSIDAPEAAHTTREKGRIGQPFANGSTKFLANLVKGQTVSATCFEADRHGREVCELFLGETSVNREMVKAGWAWANLAAKGRYLRDRSLTGFEAAARHRHLGLWAGHHPVSPWMWRDQCWKQGQCPDYEN